MKKFVGIDQIPSLFKSVERNYYIFAKQSEILKFLGVR